MSPPPPPTAAITSHTQHSLVHSRLLLVSGTAGTSRTSGHIVVHSHANNFPPQSFPVSGGRFKALLHLTPGANVIRILFCDHPSVFNVAYHPLFQNPPLHLVLIAAADSPLCYDDVPGCAEPPSLHTAVKKLRMAAYLWQAYTGTQMHEHGFGHRTFRVFETWEAETITCQDAQPRATAKVHVVRSRFTAAEIRHPSRAQQNREATEKNWLYDAALASITNAPQIFAAAQERGRLHVAAMFLDSTVQGGFVAGHAALGGGTRELALGIFGSHTLFAWPSCIENVVPAFADTRPVDTRYCAIDGEGKTYGMAANVGIGAMMHEVGHLFGSPHQPYGVMARDYPRLNRAFSVLPLPGSSGRDCIWHRLDALRFLTHPCFALPTDPAPAEKGSLEITSSSTGITIASSAGLLFIEFRVGASEAASAYMDLVNEQPHEYTILRSYLTSSVCPDPSSITISIFAADGGKREHTAASVPAGILRSHKFGTATGSTPTRVVVPRRIARLKVYYHTAFDGIEFFPPSGPAVLFGKQQGNVREIVLRKGEALRGFEVKAGWWVDAIKVRTSREVYGWFGDAKSMQQEGSISVPVEMRICAVWGSVGAWVDGFGVEFCDEGRD